MSISIRTGVEGTEIEEIKRLYKTYESWEKRELNRVQKAVENSDEILSLYDESADRIIASTRILTDYAFYAVVYDVIVDEEYRRQGYGKQLIDAVTDYPPLQDVDQVTLIAREGLLDFYRDCGFSLHPMEIEIDGRNEEFHRMVLTDDS